MNIIIEGWLSQTHDIFMVCILPEGQSKNQPHHIEWHDEWYWHTKYLMDRFSWFWIRCSGRLVLLMGRLTKIHIIIIPISKPAPIWLQSISYQHTTWLVWLSKISSQDLLYRLKSKRELRWPLKMPKSWPMHGLPITRSRDEKITTSYRMPSLMMMMC